MGIFRKRKASSEPAGVSPPIVPPAVLGLTPKPHVRGDELHAQYASLGLRLPSVLLLGMAGDTPVFGWTIDRGDPLEQWRALRERHAETGMWPFLLGKPDGIGETLSFAGGDHEPGLVEASEHIDGLVWLREHAPQALAAREGYEFIGPADFGLAPSQLAALTVRPAQFQDTGAPNVVALVEGQAGGFDVPAITSWTGAANADISGDEHLAVLRHWHDLFGAELVVLGFDTLELAVPHPPTDPAIALGVAHDQYAYCPDVIDQGFESLAALVSQQVARQSWFFWWD